jgi:signal transduction histidine kinase
MTTTSPNRGLPGEPASLAPSDHIEERSRIARELHDTVLQSVQGLILRVHAVALSYPAAHMDRKRLDAIVADAERVLKAGKDCILALREPGSGDLICGLNALAFELDSWQMQEVRIRSSGSPRCLRHGAMDNIRAICREALVNAARHSSGTQVEICVNYTRQWLQVDIEDDGDHGGRHPLPRNAAGSWGMVGMIERAAALNGSLQIAHRAGRGLKVSLRIPAASIYA